MNDREKKAARLRRFIILCAAVAVLALALGLSGWNNKRTFASAVVAVISIFYAILLYKKMYDSAMRNSAEHINALERDLKFFKDIYDLNPSMLFLIDDNLRITDFNNTAWEFLGEGDKQSLREEFSNKIEADIPKKVSENGFSESLVSKMREAARDGFSQINTIISTRRSKDYNISVAFRRIPVESDFVLLGSVTDVTELYSFRKELIKKDKMLALINRIALLLNSPDCKNAGNLINKAAEIVGRSMNVDRIYAWKNLEIDGNTQYVPRFVWIRPSVPDNLAMMTEKGFVCVRSIAEWEARFKRGEYINGPISSLSDNERERLAPYGIKSILVLPVYFKNTRGFINIDDCTEERVFAEEEVYILRSVSVMIAPSLLCDCAKREGEETP